MKNIIYLIVPIVLLFNSCKEKDNTFTNEYSLYSRGYNLQNNGIDKVKIKIKVLTNKHYKLFIYNMSNLNGDIDTLKFINDKVYLLNDLGSTLLKKIDTKIINNTTIVKYYYLGQKKLQTTKEYLFLNKEDGLIFSEYLDSGFFVEYGIKRYSGIHKTIVNEAIIGNKLFKKGIYEIEFPGFYKYPEINMMDSIKEGKRWRYFIKKE